MHVTPALHFIINNENSAHGVSDQHQNGRYNYNVSASRLCSMELTTITRNHLDDAHKDVAITTKQFVFS